MRVLRVFARAYNIRLLLGTCEDFYECDRRNYIPIGRIVRLNE